MYTMTVSREQASRDNPPMLLQVLYVCVCVSVCMCVCMYVSVCMGMCDAYVHAFVCVRVVLVCLYVCWHTQRSTPPVLCKRGAARL